MKPLIALFIALGAWRRKGLPVALDAVRLLRQDTDIDVRLRVVGDPGAGDRTLLAPYASLVETGSVELCGFHADPRPIFESAHLLLVPSYYEAFSLVMLEALKYGLPIITADVNGATEAVGHEINGFIVDRTAEGFARPIALLARNRERWAGMAAASRERARRFDAPALARRTAEVYRRAVLP